MKIDVVTLIKKTNRGQNLCNTSTVTKVIGSKKKEKLEKIMRKEKYEDFSS